MDKRIGRLNEQNRAVFHTRSNVSVSFFHAANRSNARSLADVQKSDRKWRIDGTKSTFIGLINSVTALPGRVSSSPTDLSRSKTKV